MRKVMDPNTHAVMDYLAVAALLLAPSVGRFRMIPSIASYMFGLTQLGLSAVTNYPFALVKAVPFKVHGAIEFATALQMMAVPKMLGIREVVPNLFFVGSGLALLGVWAITDYSDKAVREAEIEAREALEMAHDQADIVVESVEETVFSAQRNRLV